MHAPVNTIWKNRNILKEECRYLFRRIMLLIEDVLYLSVWLPIVHFRKMTATSWY